MRRPESLIRIFEEEKEKVESEHHMRPSDRIRYSEKDIKHWINQIEQKGIKEVESQRQKELKAIGSFPEGVVNTFQDELMLAIITHFRHAAFSGDIVKMNQMRNRAKDFVKAVYPELTSKEKAGKEARKIELQKKINDIVMAKDILGCNALDFALLNRSLSPDGGQYNISPDIRYEIVENLLKNGFDPAHTSSYGSPLHLAISLGDLKIVKLLIRYHTLENFNINSKNADGQTLLDIVHINGQIEIENYLKGLGAVYGKTSGTSLESTTFSESELKFWIGKIKSRGLESVENERRGEFEDDEIPEAIINNKTLKEMLSNDLATHLRCAAYVGDLDKLIRLRDYAADFILGLNPELASRVESDVGAQIELSEKLKNLLMVKDHLQNNALHMVFINQRLLPENRSKLVECLLQIGFDPCSFVPVLGKSPFHLAVELGDLKTLKLLVEYRNNNPNFNINLNDASGSTALDIAQDRGYKEIAEYLISVGAEPTAPLPPGDIQEVKETVAIESDHEAEDITVSVADETIVDADSTRRATLTAIEHKSPGQAHDKAPQEVKREKTPSVWAPKGGITQFRYKADGKNDYILIQLDDLTFDTYKLEKRLGNGSFGTAYRYVFEGNSAGLAKIRRPENIVVKELGPERADDLMYEVMCTLEQMGWSGVAVDEKSFGGETDKREKSYVIAATFKPGESLSKYMDEDKKVNNLDDFFKIATALVKATHEFHQKGRGWVHGDLSFNNIVIRDAGSSKVEVDLIDFGLSRPIGSPTKLEMSREKVGHAPELKYDIKAGTNIKAATNQDVYRLGNLLKDLFECTGQKNEELEELFRGMQSHHPDDRLTLPDVLEELSQIEADLKESASLKKTERVIITGASHSTLFSLNALDRPSSHTQRPIKMGQLQILAVPIQV